MNPRTIGKWEAEAVFRIFQTQFWRLNYDQFRKILDLEDDLYAFEKWEAFKESAQALGKLGDFAAVIVDAYE